jgi:hypothetical protein
MTATTINPSITQDVRPRSARAAVVFLIAAVLIVSMFFVGRFTAPSHTVHPVVAVPIASVDQPYACRMGRPC